MIRAWFFILKYGILHDTSKLPKLSREFFLLSKSTQRKVLDKYFDKIADDFKIVDFFDAKEARYYDGDKEISFFNCYYFDKLCIEHDIYNIKLFDKFKLSFEQINFLINYALEIIREDNIKLDVKEIVNYLNDIPVSLAKSVRFMKFLVDIDYTNIKYMQYNELWSVKQDELIKEVILKASMEEFDSSKFIKSNNVIPKVLINNFDFVMYLIKNDISYVKYLDEIFIGRLTNTDINNLVKVLIQSLRDNGNLDLVMENSDLRFILVKNYEFIKYIITEDLDNVGYIDWHNLVLEVRNNIIDDIVLIVKDSDKYFDIMKYDFRELFFENYNFMEYLVESDFRWIAVTRVSSSDLNDKLIKIFFDELKKKKYKFKLSDFLEDGSYLNYRLVENKKMLHYLFKNGVNLVKHIDFLNLKNSRVVVDNFVDELEKTNIEYDFKNEDFLINGKYPVILSGNYRFMRFVIDKNFNNLSYIDTSLVDKRELKRIINYAFRMVYYIRGKNKGLNFDIDGYFLNSMIIKDEYFLECLQSL